MVHMMNKMETSRWWWFDGHDNGSKRSPWLQSTLSELDRKTKAMLRLIEEDADSFAQRAEMYYKKRPELITLVEDFYRAHRSLAERYDQVKSDPGTRLITTLGSPFSSMKYCSEKTINVTNKTYDSCSETFYTEDYAESEIDDPEHEEEVEDPEQEDKYKADIIIKGGNVKKEDGTLLEQVSIEVCNDEVMKLKEELERLKEENKIQKAHLTQKDEEKREVCEDEEKREVCDDEVTKLKEELERLNEENKIQKAQLTQKDEEKREVIRQLSLAVQVLKDENMELKKSIVKESPRKRRSLEFSKLKEGLFGMLFNASPKPQASVVAL